MVQGIHLPMAILARGELVGEQHVAWQMSVNALAKDSVRDFCHVEYAGLIPVTGDCDWLLGSIHRSHRSLEGKTAIYQATKLTSTATRAPGGESGYCAPNVHYRC